jgi:hypothetical protein
LTPLPELKFDRVELIARGDVVVVGMQGPGFNGVRDDFETAGRIFHVFTLRDSLIIRACRWSRRQFPRMHSCRAHVNCAHAL